MTFKILQEKSKFYLFLLSTLILFGSIPYFAGSGLNNPEPLGNFLNNNFPGALPEGLPYVPVFQNITFDSPLTFNEVPNGNKIIVGQRDGRIFWFNKTANVANKNLMLDLSEKVGVVWDGGFLGLALHPQFGTPGKNYFYTWYTTEDANSNDYPDSYMGQNCTLEQYWGNHLILARYTANPNTLAVQESSEQILLKLRMYGTTHRGGGLLFGDDGFLYLTTGDQTAFVKAQDITNNLDGGVLRLDVDQDSSRSHPPVRTMPADHGFPDEITGNGYYIPNDNPFLSPSGQNFEEYYSLGHRNPHRMTKDRLTGELYIGEIGGNTHEEVNVVKRGRNYGWPVFEGLSNTTNCLTGLLNGMDHERPLTFFPRSEANSIIGGYVYRGTQVAELQGKYVCADYGIGEEIWTIDIATGSYSQLGNFSSTNIISFGEDEQGELYILKQGTSTLFKMVSKNNPVGSMPQFLSQTGAFQNLDTLEPVDGLIPYDLVESFWSDGAIKKRWMGVPNNGTHDNAAEKIEYSSYDVWNFPVGSVLVKHFEIPINENDPSITKRLETRFSVKASNGNFYFATYKWNNQGTDAEIIAEGLDETITVTNADGTQSTQNWRYPSNVECITCHNPSSGGTLGTRTRYLNKDYTYPKTGRTANQLVTLSNLGILDASITDSDTGYLLTSKAMNDANATLDEKARSYLDLNCAYCHRPGTGNRGDFDLRLQRDIVQTGLLSAVPYVSLGIPNEKIIDPGNSATSILYHRTASLDPNIKMPPLSKNKLDDQAVQLIDDWIEQLNPEPCEGRLILETYENVEGTSIFNLKNNENYPDSPSTVVTGLTELSIPVNVDDVYGARVQGKLIAPETGTYYFWIAGDDNVELNLSTDAGEANKTRIAYHREWTNYAQWNKYASQKSSGIDLVEGEIYYLEALVNENIGGDHLEVGWRKPSNGPGNVPFQIIPCTVFDLFNGPTIIDVTEVSLVPSSVSLLEGEQQQLQETVGPADATNSTVFWSTDDETIATVDSEGLVTAVAEGSTEITVTTEDGNFTATSIINVESGCQLTNVALNGVAKQSSTYGNGAASLAIDGQTSGSSPWSADLQHTANENQPWWEIDLGGEYLIQRLEIFNRTDALQSRLKDFYILISNTPFAAESLDSILEDDTIFSEYFQGEASLQEGVSLNSEGRYVRIQLSNAGILHMAEVEVMGCFLQESPCDGVALPEIADIEPLLESDAVQTLSATPAGGSWSGASTNGTFDPSIGPGTYEVVYTYDNGQGCVQSVTDKIIVTTDNGCTLSNIALDGIATQSSTYGNGNAALAIDGNTQGSSAWSADLQHTNAESQPWWQIDLGGEYAIEELKIFNRSDGFQARLNNYHVLVSKNAFENRSLDDLLLDNTVTSQIFSIEASIQENISINTDARYVRIQLSNSGILHMAEVEIIGCFLQSSPCDGVALPEIEETGPFLDSDGIKTLSATPEGGTWSGASTDGTFDPSIGAGVYSVTYTYDNGLGCSLEDTIDIEVNTSVGDCVLTNLGVGAVADQSSTYGNGIASLAIDGQTQGSSPWSANLQHTGNQFQPWWQVDLGARHNIDNIKIFNRTNTFQSRLNNFYVLISTTPFSNDSLEDILTNNAVFSQNFEGEAGAEETLSIEAEGRYLRIQLTGQGILHMAEVQIMGCPIDIQGTGLRMALSEIQVESQHNNIIELSPVPADDVLNVNYFFKGTSQSPVELSLFDNLGRQVLTKIIDEDSFSGRMNVSQLTAGVYVLRLQKDDEVLIKRFTVR